MKRRRIEPFEMDVLRLGPSGVGVGAAPDGRPVQVRGAPPGARIAVHPTGVKKGTILGRRAGLVAAPADGVAPECPIFGLCGGCVLQELPLGTQRAARHALALAEVAEPAAGLPAGVRVHPVRGAPQAYGYRNKVELAFGTRRYLDEAAHAAGEPIQGRWLGFHAPGRFDRVVDAAACPLVSETANAVIAVVRAHALREDQLLPWDVREHVGFWRHLLVREGFRTGELLVGLFTASGGDEAAMAALGEALMAVGDSRARVVGVVWAENDGVADVARGKVRQVWGRDHLFERLGGRQFRISVESFFQTSTVGAEVLYETIGEAVGQVGGTLLDLYCGAGSIGQVLAGGFEAVVGVEEVAAAVADARSNAALNGLSETTRWRVGRVEDALDELAQVSGRRAIVVDPPRVGLHPKVTAALAKAEAEVLVYVACKAASLGRDAVVLQAGGWVMTDLWTVDLFPQTGHVEAVARFVRNKPDALPEA